MAAGSTLLKLTPLQWNPPFSHTHRHHHHHRTVLFCSDHQRKSKLVRLQIAAVKCKQSDADAEIGKNPFDLIAIQIKKALDSLKKPAIAAVLLGLLFFYDPNCALARSGGRIGGSAFSSRSSSSSSSSSRSSSSSSSKPRSSSYSSSSSSEPSYSSSSSSSEPSYSSSSRSYSSSDPWWSSYSAPRTKHSEPQTSDQSSSWSSSSSAPPTSDPSVLNHDFKYELFVIITLCLIYVVSLTTPLRSDRSQEDTQKTSVIKLQVGLLGSRRTLQKYFDRLAESADTSTSAGLSYVLTEATLALLRHPDYCISCYSSVDVKPNIEAGEQQFNNVSIEERGKFDEETLVNVDSIKRRSSKIRTASGFTNEYIVVTILVAAEGVHKLQPINGSLDLKEALKKLGSIPRNKILAVEVLWTPQDENEVLSERELLEDYPLLKLF